MNRLHAFIFLAVLAAGCSKSSNPMANVPTGPGRFTHSAIQRTTAPWDGAATHIFLSEKALDEKSPSGPYVSYYLHTGPRSLANKRIRLEGKESRTGIARWISASGKSTPLAWVEIECEEVRDEQPVKGIYEVAFPDGKRERGRFEAKWLKAAGLGG